MQTGKRGIPTGRYSGFAESDINLTHIDDHEALLHFVTLAAMSDLNIGCGTVQGRRKSSCDDAVLDPVWLGFGIPFQSLARSSLIPLEAAAEGRCPMVLGDTKRMHGTSESE